MEKNLDRVMDEILTKPDVTGCIIADQQGLCLLAKGKTPNNISGFITAIANQANNIEPTDELPVITLESDNQICMIQGCGSVTIAITKEI